MKINVWHVAGSHRFTVTCDGIADAYEAICGMANACGYVLNRDEEMKALVGMETNNIASCKRFGGKWGYEKVEE